MILVLFRMSFELGIIGAGNMGYAVAEGAIKSDAIPGRGRQNTFWICHMLGLQIGSNYKIKGRIGIDRLTDDRIGLHLIRADPWYQGAV